MSEINGIYAASVSILDKNLKLDITIYWQLHKGKKYEVVKDHHKRIIQR